MDAQMTASRRIDWKEVVRAVKQELNNFALKVTSLPLGLCSIGSIATA